MKKNIVIAILAFCLLVAVGYISYNNMFKEEQELTTEKEDKTEKNEVDNVTEQEESSKVENLDINSAFVKDLIERYDYFDIANTEISNALYKKENLTSNEISMDYIKKTAINQMSQRNSFSKEELSQKVKQLYGPNVQVTDGNVGSEACGYYSFDANDNMYTYTKGTGCGGIAMESMERKIISATKENNTVLITVAVAILSYPSFITTPMGEAITSLNYDTFNIETDYNQLSQYQYKFSYDEANYNYYLESITKVK